jgi:hypothetical protein
MYCEFVTITKENVKLRGAWIICTYYRKIESNNSREQRERKQNDTVV